MAGKIDVAALLQAADDVFTRKAKSLDAQALLELTSALQSEMRSEQGRFSAFSNELSRLDAGTDHASADFRRISSELTHSQNRLAQLLDRIDRCLKLQRCADDAEREDIYEAKDLDAKPKAANNLPCEPRKEGAVLVAAPAAHGVTVKVKITRKVPKISSASAAFTPADTANDSIRQECDGLRTHSASVPNRTVKVVGKLSAGHLINEPASSARPGSSHDEDLKRRAVASFQHLAASFASPAHVNAKAKDSSLSVGAASSENVRLASDTTPCLKDTISISAPSINVTQANPVTVNRKITVRRIVKSVPASQDGAAVSADGIPSTALSEQGVSSGSTEILASQLSDGGTSIESTYERELSQDTSHDKSTIVMQGEIKEPACAGEPDDVEEHDKVRVSVEANTELQDRKRHSLKDVDAPSELVLERVTVKDWNPVKLLSHLYSLRLARETDDTHGCAAAVNHSGYLEHLPVGKKKMTLLKTWRKSFFKAEGGILYIYSSHDSESAMSFLSLAGGTVEDIGERTLFIDNGCGLFAMLRCRDDSELQAWTRCLESQTRYSVRALYVRPLLSAPPDAGLKVVALDIGGCSIRAGVVGTQPSLPQLFFPAVAVRDPKTGSYIYGHDAYAPANRRLGKLIRVLGSSQDSTCTFDVELLFGLFNDVFKRLCIDVSEYTVLLSLSHSLGPAARETLARLLFDRLGAAGVCLTSQALLALYLYGLTSGIVVNIGNCVDIVAVTEGYLVSGPGAYARLSGAGGEQVEDDLSAHLTSYALYSTTERLLIRYVKETACFVSSDTNRGYGRVTEPDFQVALDVGCFDLPPGRILGKLTVDSGRFLATEGLLRLERSVRTLGADGPPGAASSHLPDEASPSGSGAAGGGLAHAIARAIFSCPVDSRRAAWRGVCLCGGASLLPGLEERLQAELSELAPAGVVPQVHASPHRYHAAYIGACWLARLPGFRSACVTRTDWASSSEACPQATTRRRPLSNGGHAALLTARWGGCFAA